MEAIKAVGLTPLSVLAKRTEPKRKTLTLATISPFKNQSFSTFSKWGFDFSVPRTLQGSLVLLSSFLSSDLAKALTFNEALQKSSDFDVGGVLDSVISFAAENPIIVGGGAVVVAVPVVVSQLISKAKPWGVESANGAYVKLGEDENAELLDIRAPADIKLVGSPDIRSLRTKKKAVAVVYKGEDKAGFLKKLYLKFKEPENTTLFILDKLDGNSELVAELVTSNGFKAAYAIKDGAEGSRGWLKSGLPWILPKKTLSLDLSSLQDAIGDAFAEPSDVVPLTLGVVAAAGLGLFAFAEAETLLQILGSAALVQIASKKLLFAEDRKQTLQQIEELLNTQVAPKELVGDIQQIGKALLPLPVTSKALPALSDSADLKSDSIAEAISTPPKVEASLEPTLIVNSVPNAEAQKESLPRESRPLSPYPNYPDCKPPSSPMPSQP